MRASELVGKYAIRRSVTILSEKDKLMDTSYADPNKPVYIKDYKDGKIILLSFDRIRTILTGEYDDDKWVPINGVMYKDVIIPVGYKSVNAVYEYIDKRDAERKDAMMSIFDQTGLSVLHTIHDISVKDKSPYIVVKFYIDKDTYSVIRISANVMHTPNGPKAVYSIADSLDGDLYDTDRLIVIKNDRIFADGIARLIKENILVIGNINVIQYAVSSRFGYDGINREKDLLVDFNEPKFIIIISVISVYKVFVVDEYMYITPIAIDQLCDIESQFITAILGLKESKDLEHKMAEGHYRCDHLRLE